MNKVGKTTENRVKNARSIISSVDTHLKRIIVALVATTGYKAEDWTWWITLQRDTLEEKTDALYEASIALAHERAGDSELRTQRDTAGTRLGAILATSRASLALVNPELPKRYGLDGRTPRSGIELESLADSVSRSLEAADATYTVMGNEIHTANMAREIKELYLAYKDVSAAVARDQRQAEALLTLRDRALDEWAIAYKIAASTLENIFRMAGEPELAERIRPTVARSSGRETPDELESPPGDVTMTEDGGVLEHDLQDD
ncbi:hypothetical protein DL240_02715 [Lujinxingia litoralis]|uniref:Uncharacterized protein n=1 Tax=Lujinxingia litoralis TaxID=2211119 RepID=A0A328CCX5_9DELT|nr:hypothetical protein [Lujinxingia litoralis]RAL25141.1 hypothetical protein DL240_02715 [Lujinxingia litoralis]